MRIFIICLIISRVDALKKHRILKFVSGVVKVLLYFGLALIFKTMTVPIYQLLKNVILTRKEQKNIKDTK